MADVVFVLVVVVFFAAAALYVRACDAIVGTDDTAAQREDVGVLDEAA